MHRGSGQLAGTGPFYGPYKIGKAALRVLQHVGWRDSKNEHPRTLLFAPPSTSGCQPSISSIPLTTNPRLWLCMPERTKWKSLGPTRMLEKVV